MMIVLLRAVPVALALLLVCADGATAQPVSFPAPTQPVREGEDVTYADLVALVVPGIVVNGGKYSGGEVIALRSIGSADVESLQPASIGALGVAAVPVRSGGLDRVALLLDFGHGKDVVGLAILALFDVVDKPRLLDAVNVASGSNTSFRDPLRLSVGGGDDLLLTRSVHFNSSQGYTTTALILARNGRLEPVDMISTFDERFCAYERTQQLDVRQGGGAPFTDITAVVIERTATSGERCNASAVPEPGTRTITVTYRWDTASQRYIPDSDAFAVLARENEKRF
jgi:hypothetical protein